LTIPKPAIGLSGWEIGGYVSKIAKAAIAAKATKVAEIKVAKQVKAVKSSVVAGSGFDAEAFLAKVDAGKTITTYRAGQTVFAQGDVADTVFYIQKGRLKVVVLSEQGKEAVVGILEARQFFGEGCLNGHPRRIATTTAMEDCLITAIAKNTMIAVLHDQPKFSELFMSYLLTRNGRIEEDLIDRLFNSSEKRLAAPAAAAREFWDGVQSQADRCKNKSGDAGRDDRHHEVPRQLLHE
jgi:CRP-like cAMP-binding protein